MIQGETELKNRELVIETPEKILFHYRLAGLGSRAAAWLIDLLLQSAILIAGTVLLWSFLFDNEGLESLTGMTHGAALAGAFYLILLFFLKWGYYVFFETLMAGQSPGKRALGIKVVSLKGEALDFQSIVVRNLVRVVDDFPGIPFLSWLVALSSPHSERLGDMAAATVVVRASREALRAPDEARLSTLVDEDGLVVTPEPVLPQARRLDESALSVLRRYLNERERLPEALSTKIGRDLAAQAQERCGLERGALAELEYIERVYRAHGTQSLPEADEGAPRRFTLSENFIVRNKEAWANLAELVERARRSPRRFTQEEYSAFPRLYRQCCADLARARSLKLAPDLIAYLNESVARAHAILYSPPPLDMAGIKAFFKGSLPDCILGNFPAVLLSALLFLAPYFISMYIVSADGSLGSRLVPQASLDLFADSYREGLSGRDTGLMGLMTAFYIRNNVSIAFLSFATGILAGLGSVYFLVYNGLFLGTVEGYIKAEGFGANLHAFTLAHGPLELSGLILAGAAGLCLGYALIHGGRYRRADALRIARSRVFPLVVAFVICVASAAFIEGFISAQPLPLWLKSGIAWVSGSLLVLYFIVYPLLRRFFESPQGLGVNSQAGGDDAVRHKG